MGRSNHRGQGGRGEDIAPTVVAEVQYQVCDAVLLKLFKCAFEVLAGVLGEVGKVEIAKPFAAVVQGGGCMDRVLIHFPGPDLDGPAVFHSQCKAAVV